MNQDGFKYEQALFMQTAAEKEFIFFAIGQHWKRVSWMKKSLCMMYAGLDQGATCFSKQRLR